MCHPRSGRHCARNWTRRPEINDTCTAIYGNEILGCKKNTKILSKLKAHFDVDESTADEVRKGVVNGGVHFEKATIRTQSVGIMIKTLLKLVLEIVVRYRPRYERAVLQKVVYPREENYVIGHAPLRHTVPYPRSTPSRYVYLELHTHDVLLDIIFKR